MAILARHATTAEVLAYAPALSALGVGVLAQIVDDASLMISIERWSRKTYAGHLALSAHFGTKALAAGSSSAAGPVTSRTIDKISEGFGSAGADASDGDLGSTSYGQRYLMLRRSLMIVPLTGRVMC